MRKFISILVVLLFFSINSFSEATVLNESKGKPNSYNYVSHIYNNNDGTYTLIFENSDNKGTNQGFGPSAKYKAPSEVNRYDFLEINPSDKIEILGLKIRTPDPTKYPNPKAEIVNGKVRFKMDLGLAPVNFLNGFMPLNINNTLEVKFKVKDNIKYGSIIPFNSMLISGSRDSQTGTENNYTNIPYISAIFLNEPPKPLDIKVEFYKEDKTTVLTKVNRATEKLFVKYTITNTNVNKVENISFSQDANLLNVKTATKTYPALLKNAKLPLKTALNQNETTVIWAEVNKSNLNKTSFSNIANVSFKENIYKNDFDDENTVNKKGYVALKTQKDMGDETIQPVFIKHPHYGYHSGYKGPLKTTFYYTNNEKIENKEFLSRNQNQLNVDLTYKVNFETFTKEKIKDQILKANEKVVKPKELVREGYKFGGWYKEKELKNLYDFNLGVNSDFTLYAKWVKEEKVTVKFVTNGAKPIEDQVINKGTKALKPKDPIKAGYRFEGWFKEKALTNKFDFNTLVNEDIVLYAKWAKILPRTGVNSNTIIYLSGLLLLFIGIRIYNKRTIV